MLATTMASTTPSTMASARAVEAAKAVNSLLHFSSGDQEALLEVMEEVLHLRLKPMIVTSMMTTMMSLILKLVHVKLT